METRKRRKLALQKETLRALAEGELRQMAGGATFSCPDPVFGNASGCQWSMGSTWFTGGGGGGACNG